MHINGKYSERLLSTIRVLKSSVNVRKKMLIIIVNT